MDTFFSQLSSLSLLSITVRLLLTTVFAGTLGYERERHRQAAGFRTYIIVADAAALVAGYEIVPKEPIAQKALPECNITFISGADMKAKVSGYLKVLYDQNPEAVGGTLPDDAFYYGA